MKFLIIPFALISFTFFAQNLKTEEITYNYVKLPTSPLQPKPESYSSYVTASYEEENKKLMVQYEADKAQAEADFQRETAEYPNKVKAADEKYEREMAAWNEKSMTSKIIEKQVLNENNKPVKDYVAQPYRKTIPMPVMKTSYDYNALASAHLKIDGYAKTNNNVLVYSVTLQGFDHTQPQVKTEVKKEATVANGVSTTRDVTYYYIEFTYRHPMTARVSNGNNQEIFFVAPEEFIEYKTYKSTSSKTAPSSDFTAILKTMEDKVLKENLNTINHLVNDRIGFEVTSRTSSLDFVKSKNESHNDLMEAYTNATAGLKSLTVNENLAIQKLTAAVSTYNAALGESNLFDKKARIDKDITVAIYFNLLECYFALKNSTAGDEIISKLATIDLSNRDKKLKETYRELFLDLTNRKAANGL
jgi:hypothetical protein